MAEQSFGGNWTETKLEMVERYLNAYMAIFSRNERAQYLRPFYVDGFAGSGERRSQGKEVDSADQVLWQDFGSENGAYRGSVHRAMSTEPSFAGYVFIERNPNYTEKLQSLVKRDFPHLAGRVRILQEDVNVALPKWCRDMSRNDRAVVFLDPYGMQVNWTTIEAIAATQKIDLWLLFPLGQAVNRVLTNDGLPPQAWQDRLTLFFGSHEWSEELYVDEEQPSLFTADVGKRRTVTMLGIANYFQGRLRKAFGKGVLDRHHVLKNSTGIPLYLMFFATSNPSASVIDASLRIAGDISQKLERDGR
ncbi:MAG: three-Cys-motif partner protein TcmP [Fimbriimonadaceae bacterium]|nr:three-Cys-motif partner protein TcmP [Fimbriimonadaceae bacterium]